MSTKQPSIRVAIVLVTPFQQNCAIVFDDVTKRGTVIDPGGDVPDIQNAIRQLDVSVDRIVLTHGHIDHAGGVEDLKQALALDELPVLGPHISDKFLLDGIEEQARQFGVDGVRNCVPDEFLDEGQSVEIAGLPFSCFHCPGHSPGSLVYVNKDINFAIMGDVMFQGSIGRTDFPYGSYDDLIGSIKEKVLPLGDSINFICGHGPGSTIGVERQSNPFIRG